MSFSKASLALGITLIFGACAGAQKPAQPNVAGLDCEGLSADAAAHVLAPGSVKRVETLHRTEFLARAIQPRFVSGAALHVPAQPGMSAAYMERALSCHAVQSASAQGPDPFRVQGVENIRVSESGPMMRVAITSTDRQAAKQIVQQAEALKSEVNVEQLSTAPAQRTSF